MVRTKLKKMRLLAGKTQAEVAKAVGTSQPNYQRWESEKSKIPNTKVKKLSKVLGVTEKEILGEPQPFDLFGIDSDIEDSRTYYGEVAFHFLGGGEALLIPVSEETRINILEQVDSGVFFISVCSLDNRLIFIRRDSVADIYISSEAYEDFGPSEYSDYVGVCLDDNFWRAVECIYKFEDKFYIEDLPDGLEEKFVNDIFEQIVLTEENLDELIARGDIKIEEKDRVKKDADSKTENLIQRARYVSWQFSNGIRRSESIVEPESLVNAFYSMELEFGDEEEIIRIPFEGYYRTVLVNKKGIDYVSVPLHIYNAALLDEMEQDA